MYLYLEALGKRNVYNTVQIILYNAKDWLLLGKIYDLQWGEEAIDSVLGVAVRAMVIRMFLHHC